LRKRFHDKWQRFTELMKLFMTLTIAPHQSYYPQSPRKHRWRIWYENVLWILRFRELNRYYYIYGLDRKGFYASKRVLPYRVFTKVRDSKNLSVRDDGFNYAALLRDKFVFGQFLQSLHIPTRKILRCSTGIQLPGWTQCKLPRYARLPMAKRSMDFARSFQVCRVAALFDYL
jgi:hypothetical protein